MKEKKKILILDNILNQNYRNIQKFLNKFLNYYRKTKLLNLIDSLNKEYNNNVEIRIISNRFKQINNKTIKKIIPISDLRFKIDRNEFLKIKENIVENTKRILLQFFKNLEHLNLFNIDGIFIGNFIEYDLMRFLNNIFGEYELIKTKIYNERYDRIIFFNYNPLFIEFFNNLNLRFKNGQLFTDKILNNNFFLSKLSFLNFFISILKKSLISSTYKRERFLIQRFNKNKKNIFFIHITKNEIKSAKPVYKLLDGGGKYNVFYYKGSNLIIFRNIIKLIKFLFQIKDILKQKENEIINGLKYNNIELNIVLKEYYSLKLFYILMNTFNNLNNFYQIINQIHPSLVVLTEEMTIGRFYAKICKKNNIPTIYIPHSALPVYKELSLKPDFSYLTVPGIVDKNYLINRGELPEKIKVTGRPIYEKFYEEKIKKLSVVRDIFDKEREFHFEPEKFTILFTTNPSDDKAREKLFKIVLNSIKELDLINNLIIKLHPSENPSFYKKILEELSINPIIVKEYDILELINSSNLLIARTSTTLLEAMIIGISIIVLDLINYDFNITGSYLFLQEESLIKVKNKLDLTNKIKELISNKKFYNEYSNNLKELSKKYSDYWKDPTPSQKIVDLINSIILNDKN